MDARAPSAPDAPVAALLYGPTATGKTALAVALAALLPIEIVSADSRQVYRHLDIGTAKPTRAERDAVPHHLVDFLALEETYNAARFRRDALELCTAIRARGRLPVVVGGAGFYLHLLRTGIFAAPYSEPELQRVRAELADWTTAALLEALQTHDPKRAAAIHPHDRYRLARALEICMAAKTSVSALTAARSAPPQRFVECRLVCPRLELHTRIAARTASMLRSGWIEEVAALVDSGHDPGLAGLATLGYPHVVALVRGEITPAAAEDRINRDTRRFARHQETWFRKTAPALELQAGASENPARLAALLAPWVSRPGAPVDAPRGQC